jgi:hypothetical protein
VNRALATNGRILVEEPYRTLLTLGAAYFLWLLPQSFYQEIETLFLKKTGENQKRQILQEQSN